MSRTPKPKHSPLLAVSLFSGAGGLDYGMERAGFTTLLTTDIDPNCVDTLKANRGKDLAAVAEVPRRFLQDTSIRDIDICDLDGRSVRREIGRRVDCVYGGPPCQSFSSCGSMGSIADPRGILIFEFCRFVEEARPRTFVLENVRGLVTARCSGGEPGGVLLQLVERFERAGYGVHVKLLNAADYGSHQRRVRCFIVGVDSGLAPSFPAPSHAKPTTEPHLFEASTRPWKTLDEFLASHGDSNESNWTRPTKELAKQLSSIPDGSGLKSAGVVEATRPGGHWGYRQGTFIADKSLPARTVTGSSSQDWIRCENGSLRRLTLAEVTRLQGFPEDWQFAGTKTSKYRQVGNAVPVALGEAVGGMLQEYLAAYRPGRPAESRPLPTKILGAMSYTKREERRNGRSRRKRVAAQPN